MSARQGLFVIIAFTLWRVIALHFDTTDLFVDEAQYWLWSQHLDFGYYSKPPMIAWVIRLMTDLAGSTSIFWIRLCGPLVHMATAVVLMKISRRFIGPEVEGWVGATYITLPGVALSSVFFSTDVVLLLFLAIALFAYFGLRERRSVALALAMGLGVGCAFLSKYAILFVVPGGLLALILLPTARISWRDFFIAVLTALLVAAPNLWWNVTHDATTVRHTTDIAHWGTIGIDLRRGLEFFAAQFGVVGPIVFAAILWATYRALRGRSNAFEQLLIWLSVPIVALITLQALIAKAYANWAVTAYVAGTLLAVWLLQRLWPKGLRISLGINGAASVLFPLATIFAHQLVLPNGDEVMKRYLGRSEISREAADLARQSEVSIIVSDNRDLLADMFHTLRDQPLTIFARPPQGAPENYYEQTFALPATISQDVLFVTTEPFNCPSGQQVIRSWQGTDGYYRGKAISAYKLSSSCLSVN
ncbi:glycosyltransferase family 39 protein [Rhizobium grahamii]|uniref:Glycosyltransferase family 39 protein n=1 Tax=Rhizobium grahamii TaxID=1120045 RepID=A0A5Q0BZJ5_9HYPH|nr:MULTISPECIES: glycosyltransferase family 39 protein [Rhizobium]QFY59046.1 glycosyltransferase family 39 protein [Rhizobium grahamii]QRM48435.1 glycosyltransferase family 39 protein [Rhizobium sp. BG6]